jgi:hypothetical protein
VTHKGEDGQKDKDFSCFSASEIRVFASRRSVGRKIAKIWVFAECVERQPLNQFYAFETSLKGRKTVAIKPLSHCDKGSIATPQRLYRNTIKALSQCERASIANLKDKNEEKIRLLSLLFHVF